MDAGADAALETRLADARTPPADLSLVVDGVGGESDGGPATSVKRGEEHVGSKKMSLRVAGTMDTAAPGWIWIDAPLMSTTVPLILRSEKEPPVVGMASTSACIEETHVATGKARRSRRRHVSCCRRRHSTKKTSWSSPLSEADGNVHPVVCQHASPHAVASGHGVYENP